MEDIFHIAETHGIVPVINIAKEEWAEPLAQALICGGLPLIEVTLRSECAFKAIQKIRQKFPEMVVGAGTVLSLETVDRALAAGAEYIVTPGYDPEIVDYCLQKKVPVIPGCSTATEIQSAVRQGLKVLKFFPSELSGGLPAIKLLSGPFPDVRFLPTGGITLQNLGEYLSCNKVVACGGSFMANADMLQRGAFDEITAACKKAVTSALGFSLAHVGINHTAESAALETAGKIADIFGFSVRKCSASSFAGTAVECMNTEKYGEKGHIGFSTHSVVRAMRYLESKGVALDPDSIKRDQNGNITCIYFKEQVGGFALHIVQK